MSGILTFLFLIVIIILMYKLLKPKKPKKDLVIKKLKTLDFNDGKNSAYRFCELSRELELGHREQRLFEEIFEMLKEYKYQPRTKPIDKQTIAKIEIFIQSVE